MFAGFTEETSEFLWELSFNNDRSWFSEHKPQFERCLKKPMEALAEETLRLMEQRHNKYEWRLHISRIYRDARRLFGRGPYKEKLWFDISALPKRSNEAALFFYFEIGASMYRYGIGFHGAKSADMEAFRRAIDNEPDKFDKMAKKLLKSGRFTVRGEEYKRPKAVREEPQASFYNRKWLGIECRRDFGGDLMSPELPFLLAEGFTGLMPMYEFLLRAHSDALRDGEGSV